ncbi:hypothetical protein RUND412_005828 [Rhizina undulata]
MSSRGLQTPQRLRLAAAEERESYTPLIQNQLQQTTVEQQLRELEGLVKRLDKELAEQRRAGEWWKERVKILDDRCREQVEVIGTLQGEKRELEEIVERLETERSEREGEERGEYREKDIWEPTDVVFSEMGVGGYSGESEYIEMAHASTQTSPELVEDEEDGKNLAIKSLVHTLWNTQSATARALASCDCEASKALRELLPQSLYRRLTTCSTKPKRATISEYKHNGSPDPHPPLYSRTYSNSLLASSNSERSSGGKIPPQTPGRRTRPTLIPAPAQPVFSPTRRSPNPRSSQFSLTEKGWGVDATKRAASKCEITLPQHPHPDIFTDARKERKRLLLAKLRATKEMVEGMRRENGALEGVLREQDGNVFD